MPGLRGPRFIEFCRLKYGLRMSLGDAPYGAFGQHHAVVFNQLVHRLGERHIGPKVGDGALQGP